MKNLNHSAIIRDYGRLAGRRRPTDAGRPPRPVAGQWDNPDMEGSILNDLDRPAYVGTGLSETRARVHVYGAPGTFPNPDIDETGFVTGTAGAPKKGTAIYMARSCLTSVHCSNT